MKGNSGAWLLTCLAVLLVGGCGLSPKTPAGSREPILTAQMPFGPKTTFDELIENALALQYPPPGIDFPIPDSPGRYHVQLAHEPVTLHLAAEATSWAAGRMEDGTRALAAGLRNGDIRVWSSWPCPLLTLPQQAPVALLSWDGSGPFLGAGSANGPVHVYDLRHCAQVATISPEAKIASAALSPSLTWVAMTDAGRRLQVGPLDGPLQQIGILRYPPLALSFSPREGLLQAVDLAGWLQLWTLPDLALANQVLVPGGPFEAAIFHNRHLALRSMDANDRSPDAAEGSDPGKQKENGKGKGILVWDILEGRVLSPDNQSPLPETPPRELFALLEQVRLESGMLTYRTRQAHWLRKLHFGSPRLELHISGDNRLLRVSDVDGTRRWYDARNGLPVDPPAALPEKLRPLPLGETGRARWGGVEYLLADPVLARDDHLLLARHVPGHGFFLWWTTAQKTGHVSAQGGLLPIRRSLLADVPPTWTVFSDLTARQAP